MAKTFWVLVMSLVNLKRTNHYYYSYQVKTLATNQPNTWGHCKWHLSLAKFEVKAVDSHKDMNGGRKSSPAINFSAALTFHFFSLQFPQPMEISLLCWCNKFIINYDPVNLLPSFYSTLWLTNFGSYHHLAVGASY